jgi:thiamine biosynthesis lipoprotein
MSVLGTGTLTALGTAATVITTEPNAVGYALQLLGEQLTAVDLACSRFRSDSELAMVNDSPTSRKKISPLLADALVVSLEAARLTAGDVDPTCGLSLVRLGYDRDFAVARQDTSPLRQPPVPGGSWRRVTLDLDRSEVLLPAGVLLDLGATAKALAADQAATRIAGQTGCGVLVNLGGDISVAGDPPDGGWPVGIADDAGFDSVPGTMRTRQVVVIRDGGLATSSVLGRTWQRGGTRLHHIIDPATGRPAHSCWRTVSVAAATCVAANIASTTAIIRGERAVGWLAGHGLPARLVRHDGTTVLTGGWPAAIPMSPPAGVKT